MNTATNQVITTSAPSTPTTWDVDPSHSTVQFSVRHMMVATVRGHFSKVSGTVSIDERDLTRSKVDVTIDAASIDTREPKRDGHLRSADFFDAENHPALTFRSTRIERQAPDEYRVTGDLTIRGVTRPVVLQVEGPTQPLVNPYGQTVRGLTATGKINRKEWGLNWNAALEAGGVLVGEEVKLQLDVELVRR